MFWSHNWLIHMCCCHYQLSCSLSSLMGKPERLCPCRQPLLWVHSHNLLVKCLSISQFVHLLFIFCQQPRQASVNTFLRIWLILVFPSAFSNVILQNTWNLIHRQVRQGGGDWGWGKETQTRCRERWRRWKEAKCCMAGTGRADMDVEKESQRKRRMCRKKEREKKKNGSKWNTLTPTQPQWVRRITHSLLQR